MDKCTFCAGDTEENFSNREKQFYGQNGIAEGKVPLCASICATRALLAGDADIIADIFREQVVYEALMLVPGATRRRINSK